MYARKIFSVMLVMAWLAALAWAAPAGADIIITGALAADDGFILYDGQANGSGLTQIANGGSGAQGGINWNYINGKFEPSITPLNVSASIPAGSYLYMLVWNNGTPDLSNPQAWVGQFILPGGKTLSSNLQEWQYIYTTSGNPYYSGTPSLDAVKNQIASGNWHWATPNDQTGISYSWWGSSGISLTNTSPNGYIGNNWTNLNNGQPVSGVSPNANWIWWDQFTNSQSQEGYAIFRASTNPVPLPSTLLLAGTGLVGLLLLRRRQRVA